MTEQTTKIRFTKDIVDFACGDHPTLLYATEGETGMIKASLPGKVYLARTDSDPTWFAVAKYEFEVIPTPPTGEPTYHETETPID